MPAKEGHRNKFQAESHDPDAPSEGLYQQLLQNHTIPLAKKPLTIEKFGHHEGWNF